MNNKLKDEKVIKKSYKNKLLLQDEEKTQP